MHMRLWRAGLTLVLLVSLGFVPNGLPQVQATDNWVIQTSGTTRTLLGIDAVDANTAWAVGLGQTSPGVAPGTILKTTSGGTTWSVQTSGTNETFNSVSAVNASVAWSAGSYGTIRKTTDGGTTWTSQDGGIYGSSSWIKSLVAVDVNNAWAVTNAGIILKTTTGGLLWTSQTSGTTADLYSVAAVDANTAWVTGTGTILKTTNGGATWISQTCGCSQGLYGLTVLDANIAWAVGDAGTILKTVDAGNTWTAQASGIATTLQSVAAADANIAWAVGDAGTILKTSNGGATWVPQTSPARGTTVTLYGVAAFGSPPTVWAVGQSGVILRNGPTSSAHIALYLPVQAAQVSVVVQPTYVQFGPITIGGSTVSPQLIATNNGNVAETFLIGATHAIATASGDYGWALGPSPGTNIYSIGFGDANTGPFVAMSTSLASMTTNVAAGGTKNFFLQVKAPTLSIGTGQRNSTVTLVAVVP